MVTLAVTLTNYWKSLSSQNKTEAVVDNYLCVLYNQIVFVSISANYQMRRSALYNLVVFEPLNGRSRICFNYCL